jgi:hypothetical protein
MRPDINCYGLKSKESTGAEHVNDQQINDMMGPLKHARIDVVVKVPHEKTPGLKGAKI